MLQSNIAIDSRAHLESNPHQAALPLTFLGYLWQNEPVLLVLSALMQFSWSCFIVLGTFFFVAQMNANKDQEMGLKLCFGYLATIIIIVVSYQLKELWLGQLGASVKMRLSARVAEHALLRGPIGAAEKSIAIVLASQDSHNVCEGTKNVWQLPAALLEGITITSLVIQTAGALAGWTTAGILLTGSFFLSYMSKKMSEMKMVVRLAHDKQVTLFIEVLSSMWFWRYNGWDDYFLSKLHAITDSLAFSQLKLVAMKAVNSTVVIVFPCIPATVVFVIVYYQTNASPTQQFQAVVLSLLNTYRCASRTVLSFKV